jgi:hypothetical protein
VIREVKGAIAGDARPDASEAVILHYPLHGSGQSGRRSPDRNSITNVPGWICRLIGRAKGVIQISNQTPPARAIASRATPAMEMAISAVSGVSKRVFWRPGTIFV